MRRIIAFLFLTLGITSLIAQESNTIKSFSYAEFFDLIEKEKDTVFRLQDAIVQYNPATDTRFQAAAINELKDTIVNSHKPIIINKVLELDNVQFYKDFAREENGATVVNGALNKIIFKKAVSLSNIAGVSITQCIFESDFRISLGKCSFKEFDSRELGILNIEGNRFKTFNCVKFCRDNNDFKVDFFIKYNTFISDQNGRFNLTLIENDRVVLNDNNIQSKGVINIGSNGNKVYFQIKNNNFIGEHININSVTSAGRLTFTGNTFSSKVLLRFDNIKELDDIQWSDIRGKVLSLKGYGDYIENELHSRVFNLSPSERDTIIRSYADSIIFYNPEAFNNEMSLKAQLYKYYRNKFNNGSANEAYIDLKDFETKRLAIEYEQNKSFRTFFKWKVNQFLKLFSDYGTEPSKAIVFSVYVILIFALIYLFFPNSWDKHGRKRIMDRYTFFLKYMDKKAGIHEVYLEEKEQELMEFQEFKDLVESKAKKVPGIFTATALPLYKLAVSGTKASASILKHIDIMKGSWEELPAHRRFGKSVLLVGAFLIAILYDLIIKILNALMLSINTFTTLGFGEIPIKGLPRYLAIIQGFIGWFMLTIFSVSLISQLLN